MKAYPNLQLTVSEMGQVRSINEVDSGMDLRDYFAGQIIVGFLANNKTDYSSKLIVEMAYQLSDAMMKERNK